MKLGATRARRLRAAGSQASGWALALAILPLAICTPGCGLTALIGGLVVTSTGGGSSSGGATPPPQVSSVSPNSVSHMGGAQVTVSGSRFPTNPADLPTVTVGGLAASEVTVLSGNTLRFRSPAASSVGPVNVVVTNPRGGTGTLNNGLTLTNDAPSARVEPLALTQTLNLVFSVVLIDPESDRLDLNLEYRSGGGAYQPIPADQILSGGTTGLASSPAGVTHSLTWNTSVLFSAANAGLVQIRATPVDTTDNLPGTLAESNSFSIVNNLAPSLEVSRPGKDSFEVALSYRVADPNPGASLTITAATWRDANTGATGAMTIKSGTPAAVPGAVTGSVSGTGHTLVWDSLADLGLGNNRLIELTLTLSDGTQSVTVGSDTFFVSNGPITDADVNPADLTQLRSMAIGDLTGDGRPDAIATTSVLRTISLLKNDGQTFQSPQVTSLLGLPLPVAATIQWNGTRTLNVLAGVNNVSVGDWVSLPVAALGDPIGPRAFRVSAVAAATMTIEDPDDYLNAAGGSLLPGSARLGGPVTAPFTTLRQAGQTGIGAGNLPNDFRPGEVAILSADEDLATVASPTSDVVIANGLPPLLATTTSAPVAGNMITLTSLAPYAPLEPDAFSVGMQIQLQQGANVEQARITAINVGTNTLTLAAAPAFAFPTGTVVTGLTSGAQFVHAGHLRNHSIVVLPQTASGVGPPTSVIQTGGTFPQDLIAADLASNGGGVDGNVDLVVVNGGTLNPASTRGSVSIFLRRSTGALFHPPIVIEVGAGGATSARPAHAVVADVTSNGLLDVVVALAGESAIAVIPQGPAGTFGAATTVSLASFGVPANDINSVAVADFNEDGLPDVVCGGALSQRLIMLRGADPDGAGPAVSFPAANVASPVLSVQQSPPPPALVAGSPSAQPAATLFVGVSPQRMQAADVNGDGRVDLTVVENVQNRITVFANSGTSGGVTQFSAVPFASSLGPVELVVQDVSGDGRADILVAGKLLGDISRFQALVPGTLDQFVSFPVGSSPQSVIPIDLTPDFAGEEIVVVNGGDSSLTILARDGSGGLRALEPQPGQRDVSIEFQDKSLLSPTPGTGSLRLLAANLVTAADFNGDGRQDIVVVTQSSTEGVAGAAILLNEGGVAPIKTTTRVLLARTAGLSGVATQVVGDATPDLVLVEFNSATTGSFNVFRGAPGVTFVQDTIVSLALPSSVTSTDIDGDGDQDLLASLNASFPANFQVLLQDPAGSLAAPANGVAGGITGFTGTSYVIAADLNNDGLKDVAFTNFNGSRLGVAYQDSPAASPPTFNTFQVYLSLLQPAAITLGDLNGDGLTDMAVTFTGVNQVGVYYQRPGANKAPAAALAGPIFLRTGPSPFAAVISDVNGDGRNDLTVSSRGANTVDVFFQR